MKVLSTSSWHNSQWRLLRTPVRIGRRTLWRRVFWHKIQYLILSEARRDARLGAVTCSWILDSWSRYSAWSCSAVANWWWWCRLRLLIAGISSCLFHLNVAMQLLQDYLIGITVDDQNALLSRVFALVALKYGIGNTRSIWSREWQREGGKRVNIWNGISAMSFAHLDAEESRWQSC